MRTNNYPTEGDSGASLFERLNVLKQYVSERKRICLYLYPIPDSSTFRYRVFNLCQFLGTSAEWRGCYFFHKEIDNIYQYLKYVSVVVLCRTPWTNELEFFVKNVKRLAIPIVFDCDDLVFDVTKIPLVSFTISADIDGMLIYSSKLFMVAKHADFFSATNEYLASRLKEVFKKPVFIIPNSYNNEQLEASEEFYRQRSNSKEFKIGYFSGSPTHQKDLQVCMKEVISFLTEHQDSTFYIAGYMNLTGECSALLKSRRIQFLPFVNYVTLQGLIADVDVNIAPLELNEFTNCKSELKFFEASLVRTVTLASPSFTFSKAINHGETGFLCKPGLWKKTLDTLYFSKALREKVSNKTYMFCKEKYGPKSTLKVVERCLRMIDKIHKTQL